mgnify:CR=1 FL=1
MKTILKTAREQKNIKTRELAQLLGIDQALISKFENGVVLTSQYQFITYFGNCLFDGWCE